MPRILVADDDSVQLELRKLILESANHEVLVARSAEEAAAELTHGCDLLMMDLRFPNRSGMPDAREGLSLIRRIREMDRDVPILVLSGWPDDIYGHPEERMVSRIMLKPVPMKELLSAITELTTGRRPSVER